MEGPAHVQQAQPLCGTCPDGAYPQRGTTSIFVLKTRGSGTKEGTDLRPHLKMVQV